jgi:hypothetical protein
MTIKIRYDGYSSDLSHPGDRRRVGILTKDSDFEIVSPSASDYDVTLLSCNADFKKYLSTEFRKPILIDLIDGYLALRGKYLQDILRNIIRSASNKSRFSDFTYTNHLARSLRVSDGCIVPSPEIRDQAIPFSNSVDIILDNHMELQGVKYDDKSSGILWEGFGSNLKHLKECSPVLENLLEKYDMNLHVVTEKTFYKYGNRFIKVETSEFLKKIMPKAYKRVTFHNWSVENMKSVAQHCKFAIIPIDQNDVFARSKCENKLLAMWSLGLPTYTSETHAYERVLKSVGLEDCLIKRAKWKASLEGAITNKARLNQVRNIGMEFIAQNHLEDNLKEKWRSVFRRHLK